MESRAPRPTALLAMGAILFATTSCGPEAPGDGGPDGGDSSLADTGTGEGDAASDAEPLADGDVDADDGGTDGGTTDGDLPVCSCLAGELCADGLCVEDISAGGEQRRNLDDVPEGPRFEVPPDRVWPTSPDAPVIALWYDDAYGALSITIDDNCAPDHDWWLTMTTSYAFPATWFVITERVTETESFWGTWADFVELSTAGHSVQSHGADGGEPPLPDDPGAYDYYLDTYTRSIAALEGHITTEPIDTIGHPWGRSIRSLVAEHFIAGRSTIATINRASRIDYLNIHSTSRGLQTDPVDAILGTGADGRGWYVVHYHNMADDSARAVCEAALAYIDARRSDIWIGTLRDVARYGQERDTARLVVHEANDAHLVLSVADDMADEPFDHPLTVKARLPEGWAGFAATQGGASLRVQTVNHGGAAYGLIDVVPDRGPAVVVPSS